MSELHVVSASEDFLKHPFQLRWVDVSGGDNCLLPTLSPVTIRWVPAIVPNCPVEGISIDPLMDDEFTLHVGRHCTELEGGTLQRIPGQRSQRIHI